MANQGTTLFTHLASRAAAGATTSLDGAWKAIVDQYDSGYIGLTGGRDPRGFYRDFAPRHEGDRVEYDFDTSMELQVPGDWNTQVPELFWYEGTVWYRLRFTIDQAHDGRTFVHLGAVNHTCRVFVDGEELALHEGAFGPFAVELGDRAAPGEHSLVVMAENRRTPERIPAERTDWFNFGGLHRSVTLVRMPETFIRSAWLTMDATGAVVGEIEVDRPANGTGRSSATVSIPELDIVSEVTVGERFTLDVDTDRIERWHPGRPRLFEVTFAIDGDAVTESVGFRTLRTDGAQIVVNDEPVFFKGISIHAEGPSGGRRASGREDAATLLDWAEELGANFVRLAHYQHDEAIVAEADRRGLMVWAELPVYWGIDWANDATLANALEQTDELVMRDRCHPSVVLWSVANETLPGDERNAFLARLVDRVRELDDTRLVTAALFTLPGMGMETHIDDPLGEQIDVIGVNQYYGWYYGERADIPNKRWTSDVGKPIIFSELGAGAKAGHHGTETQIWTEEFQAAVYEAQIEMIAAQSECAGLSPWILKDFRAPRRQLPGIQDGYNRKGLVSEEGERKLAFDTLREWYATL
ncbi:MAG: glycoside hydrolase family 2 TIM barrel-domain containing protein [Actinomycetota bacterium]